MEETQQIYGGMLSKLAQLFFKGLEKAFTSAVEYKEEGGVLKQVNTIPIFDQNGNKYTITIKLAPVRDRSNMYYAEVSTTAPNLDVSSLDGKTLELNSENMKKLKEVINKLVNDKNMYVEWSEEGTADSEEDTEPAEEEATEESSSTTEVEDQLADELKSKQITATNEEGIDVVIQADFKDDNNANICTIALTVYDSAGVLMSYPEERYEIDTKTDSGKTVRFAQFYKDFKDCVAEYAKDNGLTVTEKTFASTHIASASFIKASDGAIELSAINASTEISAALDVIYDIANSDELQELMGEDNAVSITIDENGEEYSVDVIDDIDISGTYDTLFNTLSSLESSLAAYRYAYGEHNWYADNASYSEFGYTLERIVPTLAIWVVSHTDHFPLPQPSTLDSRTLGGIINSENKVDPEKLHDAIVAMCQQIIDILDAWYVNLEHQEQNEVDQFLTSLDNILAYM